MYGTLRGALAGRKIAFDRDSFKATVDGRISGIGNTIRIKSIHVHYDLAVPLEAREATERALQLHPQGCPAHQSVTSPGMPPFGSVTRPSRFEELVSREPRRCPTRQKRRGRHAGDTVTPWRGIHASADAVAKRRRGDRAGGARGGALLAGRRASRRPPCSVLRAGGCRRVPRHHARSAAASSHRADRGRWSRSTVPRALPGFSSSIEYASQPHGE